MTRPGPLYVDIETKVLLGWKVVPGTDLEVLIVQKPKLAMHDRKSSHYLRTSLRQRRHPFWPHRRSLPSCRLLRTL